MTPLAFTPEEALPATVRQYWRKGADPRYPLPEGPWQSEPDKVQWLDAVTGLPCLIVRGNLGSLCGYAGVYPGHPLHGKDYDDLEVEVHGGLTFADVCREGKDEGSGICHIPEPGTPEHVWWFGFDCAHCFDFIPAMDNLRDSQYRSVYRDVNFVKAEVQQLAAQLFEKAS